MMKVRTKIWFDPSDPGPMPKKEKCWPVKVMMCS